MIQPLHDLICTLMGDVDYLQVSVECFEFSLYFVCQMRGEISCQLLPPGGSMVPRYGAVASTGICLLLLFKIEKSSTLNYKFLERQKDKYIIN